MTAAIIFDNIGCNDPEVQMTLCLWIAKAAHFLSVI
jgi:hypothetical protein